MPGISKIPKDKPERIYIMVQNDESSAAISAGVPVAFAMDGTDDGVDVVKLPSSTAAKATSFFAGITPKAIANGRRGLAQVFGPITALTVSRQTRAASSDSYASAAAIAIGDVLVLETVAGNASRSAAGAQAANLPFLVAIGTAASIASAASTTSDESTSVTSSIAAFVRAM